MGWSDKGIERQVEPKKPTVEFWNDETGRWEAMGPLRSVRDERRGLEDAGVKERLEGLRGKGIMGWLVEGDE